MVSASYAGITDVLMAIQQSLALGMAITVEWGIYPCVHRAWKRGLLQGSLSADNHLSQSLGREQTRGWQGPSSKTISIWGMSKRKEMVEIDLKALSLALDWKST